MVDLIIQYEKTWDQTTCELPGQKTGIQTNLTGVTEGSAASIIKQIKEEYGQEFIFSAINY